MTDELKAKRDANETGQVTPAQMTPEQAALQLVTQLAAAKFNELVAMLGAAVTKND